MTNYCKRFRKTTENPDVIRTSAMCVRIFYLKVVRMIIDLFTIYVSTAPSTFVNYRNLVLQEKTRTYIRQGQLC